MREKFGRIILVIPLAVILAVIVWICLQPPEPIYAAKPLGYWIASKTEDSFDTFVIGLPLMNAKAIPYLLRASHKRDNRLDGFYASVWRGTPTVLQSHLPSPNLASAEEIRWYATRALGRVGLPSKSVIYDLLDSLKNDDSSKVRSAAAISLQELGKGNQTVVQAIIAALHDPVPEVRDAAGEALGQLDPDAAHTLLKE